MTAAALDVELHRCVPGMKHPLAAGEPLAKAAFADVRRRMMFECCKWDPQVGDVATLAAFPLLIRGRDWRQLSRAAEQLAGELAAAEDELLRRPELWRTLAVPRRLRRALRPRAPSSAAVRALQAAAPSSAAVRVLRFDFHWTDDGWRISEVNSDVPGGYAESSAFPRLMAEHTGGGGANPAGDPGRAWVEAMASALGGKAGREAGREAGRDAGGDAGRDIALLAAPGFMEDQQVVGYLARLLAARGMTPHLGDARSLRWRTDGIAVLGEVPLTALVRFYQAEWLAMLSRRVWEPMLGTSRTLVTNPVCSVLTESKRFPLVWAELRTSLPTWRRLLPETRDPRDAPWRDDNGWLLKSAYCNTGDTVAGRNLVPAKHWRAAALSARFFPRHWVAQRRFATLPIDAPDGTPMYPCVGVDTINGRAAGAYVRLSHGPVVDYRAVDAALLVTGDDDAGDDGDETHRGRS
jgi:hypothetical protein